METNTTTDDPSTTTETPAEAHDAAWYAMSAYECFIKNADKETSDADPVAAIQRVFNERASEQLKEKVASEGKTANGAYQFLWAVARLCKQTDGGCHISPETGYAIAMHYFQDVPVDVLDEYEPALAEKKKARQQKEAQERAAKLSDESNDESKQDKTGKAKKAEKKPMEASERKPTDESTAEPPKQQKPVSSQMSLLDGLFS